MISAHFLVVVLAFLSARLFDRRRYTQIRFLHVQDFAVGTSGALFCMLPTFFVLLAAPLSELWSRPSFIVTTDSGHWMRFADLLFFISAVLIPFIRNTPLKFFVLFMVSAAFLLIGSRSGVIVLFIFVAMELGVRRHHSRWFSILIFLIGLFFLSVILYLRWVGGGGVVPILRAMAFANWEQLLSAVLFGINYIINLSFVMVGEFLMSVETEEQLFTYSINPLPSFVHDMTGYYDANSRFRKRTLSWLRLRDRLPWLAYLLNDCLLFRLRFFNSKVVAIEKRDLLEAILCAVFFVFPVLLLLQYNLRTGMRLIYVFALIYFGVAVLRRIRFRRPA